jgi:type II secretory ATPase GspE/PulE/Tfp pilus assembly ATPase PilB-like protein
LRAKEAAMAKKLGEMLIADGLIDERQLELALAEQRRVGGKLGGILAELGFTTEEEISRSLARQSGVEHCSLEGVEPEPRALAVLDVECARRLMTLPLRIEGGSLVVAMANPTNIVAIDEIQRGAEMFVRVVAAAHGEMVRAIDRAYADDGRDHHALDALIQRALEEVQSSEGDRTRGAVAGLVDEILLDAVRRDATDVHFQPDRRVVRVRHRVDGDLRAGPTIRRELLAAVVARIKVLADLDISETRLPQDGRIRLPVDGRRVDLRVSTFPSLFGESVVVRVLDRDRRSFGLEGLGLDRRGQEILARTIRRPNGLVLASGPTGSGKTTTPASSWIPGTSPTCTTRRAHS